MPFVAIDSFGFAATVAVVLTAWAVRRYAFDSEIRSPVPFKVGVAAFVAGLLIVGSYIGAHPLTATSTCSGSGPGAREFVCLNLRNAGFADLRILSVRGLPLGTDSVVGPALRVPATLAGRGRATAILVGTGCAARTVTVRYRVLGVTQSKAFRLHDPWHCGSNARP